MSDKIPAGKYRFIISEADLAEAALKIENGQQLEFGQRMGNIDPKPTEPSTASPAMANLPN